MNESVSIAVVLFLYGAVAAKWGMELGYSQLIQLVLFFTALFLGPLVLLILYVKLLYQRRAQKAEGAQWVGRYR